MSRHLNLTAKLNSSIHEKDLGHTADFSREEEVNFGTMSVKPRDEQVHRPSTIQTEPRMFKMGARPYGVISKNYKIKKQMVLKSAF